MRVTRYNLKATDAIRAVINIRLLIMAAVIFAISFFYGGNSLVDSLTIAIAITIVLAFMLVFMIRDFEAERLIKEKRK